MRDVFQQELREVQDRLVETAELVLTAITQAAEAFGTSNVALAEQVIADDEKIDQLTVGLDELAINILARQQPVARDLRIVVSALRISATLERMGDIAAHIAQLARFRFPELVIPEELRSTFDSMATHDIEAARSVIELLRTTDPALAAAIRDRDDTMDLLHERVFQTVLGGSWNEPVETTVDTTLASRYHERFGDHAVSIAKKVLYLSTGEWDQGEVG